jgi:hypothetical protein
MPPGRSTFEAGTSDDRTFETEGEVIESGLRQTIEERDMVIRDRLFGDPAVCSL